MELLLLKDILIILALSMVVLFICHRLKVPAVVGFLLTGVVVGPHGLGLITADKEVEVLAEIGVVMLLFTIGIEFSLKDLVRIRRAARGWPMRRRRCKRDAEAEPVLRTTEIALCNISSSSLS